jgi:hypothetical protein
VREVVGGPDPEGHLGRVRGEQARHDVHQVPDFALVDRQDERFGSRKVAVDRADPDLGLLRDGVVEAEACGVRRGSDA